MLYGTTRAQQFDYTNGLRLVVVEDSSSPTFAYQTWFRVGSKNEEKGHTGLAHFFEHLLFKRTKNTQDGEFMKRLEKAGSDGLNAFTGKDMTAYIQSLPKKALPLIIKLESDRMQNLVIDDKAFYSELAVVKNERLMRQDNNPDGTLLEALFALAYQVHPYGWPIIGFPEDLDAMKPEHAKKFYQENYTPENAIVVVVGDVNAKKVSELVDHAYGSIPRGTHKLRTSPPEPPQDKPRRRVMKVQISTPKIFIGYHIPPVQSEDTVAFEVLETILASSQNSRLRKKLVDTGLASDVGAGSFQNSDPSYFLITAKLQEGKSPDDVEPLILSTLKELREVSLSDAELESAKNLIRLRFYSSLEKLSGVAYQIGSSEVKFGDIKRGFQTYQEQLDRLTPEKMKSVLTTYFKDEQRSTLVGEVK